jgi:hypothetical protein
MSSTPILGILEIAPGQDQKEDTANAAIEALEAATQDELAISYTADARVLTTSEFSRHLCFVCPSNGAAATLTVPLGKRLFMVDNRASTLQVSVGGPTGASVVVPGGAAAVVRCNGTDCFTPSALATTAGVLSLGGVDGAIGIAGNLVLAGGTLTLSGMAAEAVPSAGIVGSTGTHVATATIGAGLAFSDGTLSAGVTLDGDGLVPFALMQPELQNVPLAISHPGTMANGEVLMIVPVNQTLTLPSGLSGAYVITNGSGDLPAATTTLVVSTLHAGSWTAQGTLSVDTGGTLSVANGLTADATLVPGDGLRVIGQATADAQFGNFGLVVMLKKVAG